MKRRAQIKQVFVYITAMLVIGFLVLFGFRMVYNLLNKQCDVSETQFSTQVTTILDKSARYGTVKNPILPSPCDYKTLCFIGAKNVTDGDTIEPGDLQGSSAIISSVQDKIPYNVYLIDKDKTVFPVMWDERIVIGPKGAFCINKTGNKFTFWTKGLGKEGILLYADY